MQVLIFGAPWCASCTVLKKSLAGLTFPGFEIEHVNVDANPEVATQHGVKSLPTIVVPSSGLVRRNVTTAKQFADMLGSL
jgi:thioredoxin-like negative regulator of GroEL